MLSSPQVGCKPKICVAFVLSAKLMCETWLWYTVMFWRLAANRLHELQRELMFEPANWSVRLIATDKRSAENFLKHFRGCSNYRDEPRMVLRAHWTANRPGDHRTCTARKCKCTPAETKSANKSMDVTLIPFLDFVVKSGDITWPIHPIKVLWEPSATMHIRPSFLPWQVQTEIAMLFWCAFIGPNDFLLLLGACKQYSV